MSFKNMIISLNRLSLRHLCFVYFCVCFHSSGRSAEYLVEGVFSFRESLDLFDEGREDISLYKGNFTILVKDCKWIVRWSQSNEPFDYQECGTDGNVVYTVRSVESQAQKKRKSGGKVANEFIGNIQKGFIPNPGTTPLVPVLWWTFASGCYLSTNTDKTFLPIYYNELTQAEALHISRQKLPADISLGSSSLGLPSSVVFMDDGIKKSWEQLTPDAGSWGSMQKSKRPLPYDQGFTNCVLKVLTFTNLNSFEFPLVTDVRIYAPKASGKLASDLDWRKHYCITLTNVSLAKTDKITVPMVSGKMFTSDARFIADTPIVMKFGYVSDQEWLPEEAAKKTQGYKEALADARRALSKAGISTGMQTSKKKMLVVFFLALLSALALVLGLKRTRPRAC